ncbi:growth arrest and DNA damage-inducible protein GADD45 beta-like [Pholidichthys leucotaenia]
MDMYYSTIFDPSTIPEEHRELHRERVSQMMSEALEKLMSAAQTDNCFTVGLQQCAEVLNEVPDSVYMCIILLEKGEYENFLDFQLKQYCLAKGIHIVRVTGMREVAAQRLGIEPSGELRYVVTMKRSNRHTDIHYIEGFCYFHEIRGRAPFLDYSPRVYQ